MKLMTPSLVSRILLLGLATSAVACVARKPFFRSAPAASARDAGSVHVAILAVAPWSHYESALQPEFHLEPDEALDLVVRENRRMAETSLDMLSLSAAAVEDPEDNGSPQAPDLSTFSEVSDVSPSSQGVDALLQYTAATTLYQEVQLLNRFVRDAPVPSGYRPYLVRLQISLMPRRRNEPYDAYTTLSFFSPEAVSEDGEANPRAPRGTGSAPETSPFVPRGGLALAPGVGSRGPLVIPLLVTDNLEASSVAHSMNTVRNLALSLFSLPGSFATDLTARVLQNELKAQVQGRDLNSLLTVARLSDNTLRVRLGAMQQATAELAMVPRNHNITLLLAVPESAPPFIQVMAKTTLIDTGTGEELGGTSEEELESLLRGVRRRYSLEGLTDDDLEHLLFLAQMNDQERFLGVLRAAGDADSDLRVHGHALWIDLVSLMAGSQFGSCSFELPGHGLWSALPSTFYEQTVLLVDEEDGFARAVIHGAAFTDSVAFGATIRLEALGRELSLPASSVVFDGSLEEIHLEFPSLRSLGLLDEVRADPAPVLVLTWADEIQEFDALYVFRGPGGGS